MSGNVSSNLIVVVHFNRESHEYVRSLVTTAAETVESVDMSMLVVDAVKRLDDSAMDALEKVITASAQVSSPIMLVMNKCDLVGKREEINMDLKIRDISQMIEEIFKDRFDPDESSLDLGPLAYIGDNALKVSALKGNGMRHLEKTLVSLAVDRPWYGCDVVLDQEPIFVTHECARCGCLLLLRSYHSSMVSDQSDLDLVTEIIREKLFRRFNKELPYAIEQENVYVCVAQYYCHVWMYSHSSVLWLHQWLDQVQGQEHPHRPRHLCTWPFALAVHYRDHR